MKKDYTAIPGLGIGRGSLQVGSRKRLYQGPDHLLLVQSMGYTEDYRRVFYRDIRCVLARQSNRYPLFNVIFTVLILGAMALYFSALPQPVVFGLTIFFGICLVVNLVKGASCDCYVITNVQTLIVPTPQRLKKVPVLIEFLKTKVLSLQSETVNS